MILDTLRSCPVIGIMRGFSEEDIAWALSRYLEAGFRLVEVTMNSPGADRLIRQAVATFGEDLRIGAGTVRTAEELARAHDSGASFIVTPALRQEVVEGCWERDLPFFPGAFTPTEVEAAWRMEATGVKVFPASLGGAEYIRALRGPFPDIRLLPTGGVAIGDIPDYRSAGAYGLGLGSPLFPRPLIENRQDEAFRRQLNQIHAAVRGWHTAD